MAAAVLVGEEEADNELIASVSSISIRPTSREPKPRTTTAANAALISTPWPSRSGERGAQLIRPRKFAARHALGHAASPPVRAGRCAALRAPPTGYLWCGDAADILLSPTAPLPRSREAA